MSWQEGDRSIHFNGIPDSPTFHRAVEDFFEELLNSPREAAHFPVEAVTL